MPAPRCVRRHHHRPQQHRIVVHLQPRGRHDAAVLLGDEEMLQPIRQTIEWQSGRREKVADAAPIGGARSADRRVHDSRHRLRSPARTRPSPVHPPRGPALRYRAPRRRETPRRPRTHRSASARWKHPSNPVSSSSEMNSCSSSAPATHPTQSSMLWRTRRRHVAPDHHVGHRQPPARLEHAKRLGEDLALVDRQVDHAVRDDHVHRVRPAAGSPRWCP